MRCTVRRRDGRHGRARLAGQLEHAVEALLEHLVVSRELHEVNGAGADDVAQGGVGPAGERQQQVHVRQLIVDDLQAGQAGAGRQAGPGDQHVEGTFGIEQVADGAHPGDGVELGTGAEVVHHPLELLTEALAAVEDEDLGVSHLSSPQPTLLAL